MGIERLFEVKEIFRLVDKLGVSTGEAILILLAERTKQLERAGLNAATAGANLRKALQGLEDNGSK